MREQSRRAKVKFRLVYLPVALVLSALGCGSNDDDLFHGGDGSSGGSGGDSGPDPSASGSASTPNGGDSGVGGAFSVGGTGDASSAGSSGASGTPAMPAAGTPGSIGEGGTGGDVGPAGAGAGGESGSGIVLPTGGTGGSLTGCAAPSPACVANAKGMEEKACGNCGKSTRTRTCNAQCTWGAWSDWSACGSQGECAPNATGTMSDRCPGACGPRTLTRTCSNSCTWGGWSVTASTCVACTECAEVVYCDAPGDDRGTWCRQTNGACTDSEINAECSAILGRIDCVRVEPYYLEHQ
jgi:hypothetical protein